MKRSCPYEVDTQDHICPEKQPRSQGRLGKHSNCASEAYRYSHVCSTTRRCCPDSLSELAAKVAAANVPFQLVEERYNRVPEPVVLKLITWSFPRCEADIRRYSALAYEPNDLCPPKQCGEIRQGTTVANAQGEARSSPARDLKHRTLQPDASEGQDVTFRKGVTLAESGAVRQSVQIGFHLSGVVHDKVGDTTPYHYPFSSPKTSTPCKFNVAVTFDRCKVTSSTCNCQHGDGIFFCRHVVALLIFRMRNSRKVKLRAPISDTLQKLSRDQLQKLTQYLLSRHANVLPTAQEIADCFSDVNSSINAVHGAPDPTAGAGFQDEDRWNLDDSHVTNHVRQLILESTKQASANQLFNMIGKIREMMKVRDCNGARLLTLLTEELLRQVPNSNSVQHNDVCAKLWDQIGLLWICIVLNPRKDSESKSKVLELLTSWNEDPHCPPEDSFTDAVSGNNPRDRSVLSRAMDACSLRWDDPHLKLILRRERKKRGRAEGEERKGAGERFQGGFANFSSDGKPLWHENTPIACARVEALRSHGYANESVRLARAVARTIRENAISGFKLYQSSSHSQLDTLPVKKNNGYGLVGHPLNPIHILFDTLMVAAINKDEETQKLLRKEAFEVCLLGVGEQRCMPSNARAQEKVLSCEKMLIEQLERLTLDDELVQVLREVTTLLMEGGPGSGLGKRVHRESVPIHSFANYLFKALLPYDRKLVFRMGLQAMRMTVLDDVYNPSALETTDDNQQVAEDQPADNVTNQIQAPQLEEPQDVSHEQPPLVLPFTYPATWSVIGDLEARQYQLASTLLQTAKGEVMLLRLVVESVQRHMRNGSHVFQLSHDAFKCATNQSGAAPSDITMLNVAMQLAMQVLRMTMQGGTWRRTEMVGWLVTCATEIGLCALVSIIKTWYTLFTPVEASTMVAGCVISPNTAVRLNLDPRQREQLYHSVCQMAMQCAVKDPQSCALRSLSLCETYTSAFDAVYHVIVDSSNKRRIDSAQLFTIARYLDQRGFNSQAFTVAHAATRRLRVPFNHDAHPSANDLLWTTQLAQSLGMTELEDLILVIVNKVRCASVLSDVLRTCTSSISGRMPNGNYGNRGLRADRGPLRPLLEAAIAAYVKTIHNKLSHISPRHYTEFIDFLNKARETFLLAPDGHSQFGCLLANLKTIYKGKKKLLNLVALRFG
uniref:zinc finger SWIM domain-containing protein 4-like n=1 Tax=Ciona intestinalis TaxID=7719 RepID=UPI000180D352|nr:zinc finger SWIM domain-containing protein 4-like [Ciona intestinalis]|eukprot:XP_002126311.1 zinc finger SWIM domain-containing protein 4-like [Ciona intestinalis]